MCKVVGFELPSYHVCLTVTRKIIQVPHQLCHANFQTMSMILTDYDKDICLENMIIKRNTKTFLQHLKRGSPYTLCYNSSVCHPHTLFFFPAGYELHLTVSGTVDMRWPPIQASESHSFI